MSGLHAVLTPPAERLPPTPAARPRGRLRPLTDVAALVLLALGLLLPPHAGALLASPVPDRLGAVENGIWLLKALLLLHGALLALLPRVSIPVGDGRALVASEESGVRFRGEALALTIVLATALGLRLYHLGDGLWFDEIQTLVDYVRLPLAQLLTTYDSQNQHMLYSVLARLSVLTFGESAWALRLPAALLGVGGIAAVYAFGRRIADGREALFAAALLAVSYQDVWFSQNARGYTGLLLGTLASSALFLDLLREGRPRGWRPAALYAVVTACTLFVHVTAAFVVAGHGIVWLVATAGRRRRLHDPAVWMPLAALVLAGTVTLLLYAPVLPQFRGTLGGETMAGVATAWKQPSWLVGELLRGLARGVPGGLLTVAVGAAVFGAGLVSYLRRDPAATALMLLPPAATAAAIVAMHHNLWPRFFFAYVGFGALIAVRGVYAAARLGLGRQGPRVAAAVLALGTLAVGWGVRGAWHPKQDYAGALSYALGALRPGDALVATDMSSYVLRRLLAARAIDVTTADQIRSVQAGHRRTWAVYTFPDRIAAVNPALWAELRTYRVAREFRGTLAGGSVFVAARDRP